MSVPIGSAQMWKNAPLTSGNTLESNPINIGGHNKHTVAMAAGSGGGFQFDVLLSFTNEVGTYYPIPELTNIAVDASKSGIVEFSYDAKWAKVVVHTPTADTEVSGDFRSDSRE